MTDAPVVTVVTPTKNRLELLIQTMDSVAAQTCPDWEHIVVDDGSDDGTEEYVRNRAHCDSRVRYLRRTGEKAGANVCRNLGLREARGDLIVFLDSDDLLRPESLQRRVDALRANHDLDFAVFQAEVFADIPGDLGVIYHRQQPGDDLLRFLSLDCVWQTTGPVWRRAFLDRIGGFEDSLLSMQDLEMHVRALAARGKYLMYRGPDHDIRGRVDPSRTSARHFTDPNFIRGAEDVCRRLYEAVDAASLMSWARRRAILGLAFGTAEAWIRVGAPVEAHRAWREACQACGAGRWLERSGVLMLRLCGLDPNPNRPAARLANKWKDWARLRPEPVTLAPAHAERGKKPA